MASLREVEAPLRAWESFRAIARATRSLAAAQSLRWAEHARQAELHLAWCEALAARTSANQADGSSVFVVLGTDLGLCGPLNRAVARSVADVRWTDHDLVLVVGERVASLLDIEDAMLLPAPSSIEAVSSLAGQIEEILNRVAPADRLQLRIALTMSVDADGIAQPGVFDRPWKALSDDPSFQALEEVGPVANLCPPDEFGFEAGALLQHAWIVSALIRSAASESEARYRVMNRAHEVAGRRIAQQWVQLRKQRQEVVTQEMLEARQGARKARGA